MVSDEEVEEVAIGMGETKILEKQAGFCKSCAVVTLAVEVVSEEDHFVVGFFFKNSSNGGDVLMNVWNDEGTHRGQGKKVARRDSNPP